MWYDNVKYNSAASFVAAALSKPNLAKPFYGSDESDVAWAARQTPQVYKSGGLIVYRG